MQTITINDVKRLPLWERVYDMMLAQVLDYGKSFDTRWLELELMCARNTIEFGAAISAINDRLMPQGYYLSSRGQYDKAYILVSAMAADKVADSKVRKSFREIRRAISLYTGLLKNPKAELDNETKRKIEAKAAKNALRLALMSKPISTSKELQKMERKSLTNN